MPGRYQCSDKFQADLLLFCRACSAGARIGGPIRPDTDVRLPIAPRGPSFRLLLAVAVVGGLVTVAASEVFQTLAASDEKLTLDGVANFGRLTPHFYRGAQPRVDAYPSLLRYGIDTVVRLSTGEEFIEGERGHVEGLGMRFVSLPWRAADTPTTGQVAAFLDLFREEPARTIFVHCREGVDRTGVMVAIYRIAVDHFTTEQAIAEMKAFHYRYLFHPHLETYVEAFPLMLAHDRTLQAMAGHSSD